MTERIRDLMMPDPVALTETMTVEFAARFMRDSGIGTVIVVDGSGDVRGIVTDRDIVVRVVAAGRDPAETQLGDIESMDLTTVDPSAATEDVIGLMRTAAVRRLPVVEDRRAVGIVSLGDLTMETDPGSALASISAAPANT